MLIAEVRQPDGRSLNQELVRAGYAWRFRRYAADSVLARLEADARIARPDLWTDPRHTPTWDYRSVGLARVTSDRSRRSWTAPFRFALFHDSTDEIIRQPTHSGGRGR